jgi:hypothetical protein
VRRLEKDLDFIEECLHRENDSVRVMDMWKLLVVAANG